MTSLLEPGERADKIRPGEWMLARRRRASVVS